MTAMRSSLAKFQPITPMNQEELYAKKHEGWNEHDILVVMPEQRVKLTNKELEVIVNVGNKLYGSKNGR